MKFLTKFFVLTLLILYSCQNRIDNINHNMIGIWTIDTIYYKGNDIRLSLDLNVISFKKKLSELPVSDYYRRGYFSSDKYSKWKIIDSNNTLFMKFKTINPVFKGNNKIFLYNDRGLLKMRLISDSLTLTAAKLLYSYKK